MTHTRLHFLKMYNIAKYTSSLCYNLINDIDLNLEQYGIRGEYV